MKNHENLSTMRSFEKPSTLVSSSQFSLHTNHTPLPSRFPKYQNFLSPVSTGIHSPFGTHSSRQQLNLASSTLISQHSSVVGSPEVLIPQDLHNRIQILHQQIRNKPILVQKDQTVNKPAVQLEEEKDLLSNFPRLQWCAYCGKETTVEVAFRNSAKTLWSSISIFLAGGFLGCFLLPYMTNSCKQPYFICIRCKHSFN